MIGYRTRRERARARLAAAREGGVVALPPFQPPSYEVLADRSWSCRTGPTQKRGGRWDEGLPRGVRIVRRVAWRIILILVAGTLLLRLLGIAMCGHPVAVALLLAALLARWPLAFAEGA